MDAGGANRLLLYNDRGGCHDEKSKSVRELFEADGKSDSKKGKNGADKDEFNLITGKRYLLPLRIREQLTR